MFEKVIKVKSLQFTSLSKTWSQPGGFSPGRLWTKPLVTHWKYLFAAALLIGLSGVPTPTPPSSSNLLHIGQSIVSTVADLDTPDRFVVFGAFGDLISVGVFPQVAGAPSPSLEIDAPDGTAVADVPGTTNALVSALRLPATGAYIVYVKAPGRESLVPYTLSVGEGWILRDLDGGALTANVPAHGSLTRLADRGVWRLIIPAGLTFTIAVQPLVGSALDPVIELVTPGGDQLAVAHDFNPTRSPETALISAPIGGTYWVRISAYINASVGGFDLIVRTQSATPTPVVTSQPFDQHVVGHVAQGTQFNDTFWGVPGQTVTIAVQASQPGSFDPLVELYGPSGRRVAAADDSGSSADPSLTATLNDGIGIYFVRVSGYALMAGDFTLTVKSP